MRWTGFPAAAYSRDSLGETLSQLRINPVLKLGIARDALITLSLGSTLQLAHLIFNTAGTAVHSQIRSNLASRMDGQVLECLRATLSPDQGTRRNAEEQLKQLFQHPG
jgi:hypothetical protein